MKNYNFLIKSKVFSHILAVINLLLILALLISFALALVSTNPGQEKITAFAKDISSFKAPEKAPTLTEKYPDILNKKLEINGWISAALINEGLIKYQEKSEFYDSISPVFYELDEEGKVIEKKNDLAKVKEMLKGKNTKLIPSILGISADGFSKIVSDEKMREEHIQFILNEVKNNNFDGFDLDYELIYTKDKTSFYKFLKRLDDELNKVQKSLSITILSQWGDDIEYEYAPQTRKVQDYSEISKYGDMIRIMTYDYTGSGNTSAGPIAPVEWVEKVLTYATTKMPKEKIVLGIPLYNYFWDQATESAAVSLQYDHIYKTQFYNSSAKVSFDDKTKEGIIEYTSTNDNKIYKGYFASPESIKSRIELAEKFNIYGISFWQIGHDPF